MNTELEYQKETGLPSRKRNTGNPHSYTNEYIEWLEQQVKLLDLHESAFTEVYLKNHGWQKLLSQSEHGIHEGLKGIYYLVDGFGKVHEKYCKHFR